MSDEMTLFEYLYIEEKDLFNSAYTYPEWLTSSRRDAIQDMALYDFGNREIRPYLLRIPEVDKEISPELETVIQDVILNFIDRNSYKYNALFQSEGFTYDPIENYNMTETMTDDTTETEYGRVDTRTLEKDSSDTRTYDLTDERTPDLTEERTPNLTDTHTLNSLTNTETDEIQGFNSSAYQDANRKTTVGTGSEDTTTTGSDTTTTTGTDTNTKSGTDTLVYSGTDTDTNTQSGKDTSTRNYTLTRTGNIGVQTTQDMIEKFRNIADFSALSILAHDIVNVITLRVY